MRDLSSLTSLQPHTAKSVFTVLPRILFVVAKNKKASPHAVASLRARESNHRVEFGGAARGQIAGEKRDDDKQKRNREIRRRIIWPHIEKQTCHDARESEGTGQSGDNTNRGQRHSLPND